MLQHTHNFLSLLGEASIKQPQFFTCLGKYIKVADYDLLLDSKDPVADGHPLAVLSSRTLSCQTVVNKVRYDASVSSDPSDSSTDWSYEPKAKSSPACRA